MTIDASELADLADDLDRSVDRVGAQRAKAVRDTADAIVATARRLVSVDTGRTRSSIGYDLEGDGRSAAMTAVIGPTTFYARFVEHGTAKAPPRPFMAPAADQHENEFVDVISDIGGDLL